MYKVVGFFHGLCVVFYLLMLYPNDTAETEWYYSINSFKKPSMVWIGHCTQCIVQLNAYLELLPCIYYSQHSNQLTKMVLPFDDADLASHILQICPMSWQSKYSVTAGHTPRVCKDTWFIQKSQKGIPSWPKTAWTMVDSYKGTMVSFSYWIPRRHNRSSNWDSRYVKHCVLFNKHGGAYMTHNMLECCQLRRMALQKQAFQEKFLMAVTTPSQTRNK